MAYFGNKAIDNIAERKYPKPKTLQLIPKKWEALESNVPLQSLDFKNKEQILLTYLSESKISRESRMQQKDAPITLTIHKPQSPVSIPPLAIKAHPINDRSNNTKHAITIRCRKYSFLCSL